MKPIIFILILFVFPIPGLGQCRNLPTRQTFAQIRVMPPVRITDYSGQKLYFTVSTKEELFVGEMRVDELTEFPVGFEKDYKSGLWFVFYCEDTQTILWVQKVKQAAGVKMETKAEQEKRLKQ